MLWPNNKRLALMLSFDIDAETLWLTRSEINKNHPANLSRGLYSVKQGIPRILRMLEEENQHATFFTTAYTAELHPEVIKYIAACGHEIAYHGYLHEVYDTYEKENALMAKAEHIIKALPANRWLASAPRTALYTIFTFSCGWTGDIFIPPTGAITTGRSCTK